MNEELKPCPCCGSKRAYRHRMASNNRSRIYCFDCGIGTPYFLDIKDAEKVWNRRAGGIKLAEARNEFMDVVYDELSDDADNCRANRIIDAADEIYEVLHRSGEE